MYGYWILKFEAGAVFTHLCARWNVEERRHVHYCTLCLFEVTKGRIGSCTNDLAHESIDYSGFRRAFWRPHQNNAISTHLKVAFCQTKVEGSSTQSRVSISSDYSSFIFNCKESRPPKNQQPCFQNILFQFCSLTPKHQAHGNNCSWPNPQWPFLVVQMVHKFMSKTLASMFNWSDQLLLKNLLACLTW